MSASHRATAEAVSRVSTGGSGEHPRPKVLGPVHPRLAPVRVDGRRVAADALRRALRDEEESMRHVARVLGVSKEMVQRWCDPQDKRQFPVGDLVALAIAGSTTIVYAYLDEVARFLMARARTRRTPLEHAVQLAVATGRASSVLTEDGADRSTRVRALRAVKFAADEALADLEAC